MKKIKYILFTFLILSLSILSVNAECTKEEINTLKQEANKIKVTYKHLGGIETAIGTDYSRFKITVKNIEDDFSIYIPAYGIELEKNNEMAEYELGTGNWTLEVYSEKCDERVHSISFRLPTFNKYSLDPLCEGIDGEDFSLCGKYLEYEVSYDTFKRKVEEYKKAHEVKKVEPKKDEEQFSIKMIINKVLEFIINYQIYIIIILGVLLLLLIIIIIVKKKKKRGVLE